MIRFIPDTLVEWVLRPVAMVAPNGWVYTEIMAPDFRFVMALVLAALLGIGLLRSGRSADPRRRALAALGVLTVASFVPWLATTGNGRYFMPFLILVGPLCVALAARLRVTPAMRGFAVTLMVAAQGFALAQNSPWKPFDSWEWIAWKEAPFFHLETEPVQHERDATYVTISNLTFGVAAPLFPATVRWVNLSAFDTAEVVTEVEHYQPVATMLHDAGKAGKLRLFQRAHVREMDAATRRPTAHALDVMNGALVRHRLKVRDARDCTLLRSRSLVEITAVASGVTLAQKNDMLGRTGFYVCSLEYVEQPPPAPQPTPEQLQARRIFERIEAQCPRFFAPGQLKVTPGADDMWMRSYPDSDATLMVTRSGAVFMKYERAINPQLLSRAEKVLHPDFRLDCNSFNGRSGLPWEREI